MLQKDSPAKKKKEMFQKQNRLLMSSEGSKIRRCPCADSRKSTDCVHRFKCRSNKSSQTFGSIQFLPRFGEFPEKRAYRLP